MCGLVRRAGDGANEFLSRARWFSDFPNDSLEIRQALGAIRSALRLWPPSGDSQRVGQAHVTAEALRRVPGRYFDMRSAKQLICPRLASSRVLDVIGGLPGPCCGDARRQRGYAGHDPPIAGRRACRRIPAARYFARRAPGTGERGALAFRCVAVYLAPGGVPGMDRRCTLVPRSGLENLVANRQESAADGSASGEGA